VLEDDQVTIKKDRISWVEPNSSR